MNMPNPDFIERYTSAGGPASRVEAVRLARAGLSVLACALPAADRRRLTAVLPAGLSEMCRGEYAGGGWTLQAAVERFAEAADLEDGDALEQLQVLAGVVAERLTPSDREILRERMPDDLAALLNPPARGSRPPSQPSHRRHSPGPADRTLAGADGGGHTLADGAPDRAQTGSVADWDERRMSHTLGGYGGKTPKSLAEGHAGSDRPVSGDKSPSGD